MARISAGILALVGAALVAASSFVPLYEFADFGFTLVDFDAVPRSMLFFGLENAFVTVAAAVAGIVVLTSGSRAIGGFLTGIGGQTVAVFAVYFGWILLDEDSSSTLGAGSGLGLAGGILILAAGIAVWTVSATETTEGEPLEEPSGVPAAGWYADPAGAAQYRYWTGHEWSAETHD